MATENKKNNPAAAKSNSRKSTNVSKTKNNSSRNTKSKAAGNKSRSTVNKYENNQILDIILVVFFGITILLYLANFNMAGKLGEKLIFFTFGLFGFMGYFTPLLILIAVCFLVSNERSTRIWLLSKMLLGFILVVFTGTFFTLFSIKANTNVSYSTLYDFSITGKGGGIFGNSLVLFLYPKCGKIASIIIMIVLWIINFLVLTDFSLIDWVVDKIELYKIASDGHKEIRSINHEAATAQREVKLEKAREKKRIKVQKAIDRKERADLDLEKIQNAKKALSDNTKQAAIDVSGETNKRLGREIIEIIKEDKEKTEKLQKAVQGESNIPQISIFGKQNEKNAFEDFSNSVLSSEKTSFDEFGDSGYKPPKKRKKSSADERKKIVIPDYLKKEDNGSDSLTSEPASDIIPSDTDINNETEKFTEPTIHISGEKKDNELPKIKLEAVLEASDSADESNDKLTKIILGDELTNIHQMRIKELPEAKDFEKNLGLKRKPFKPAEDEDEKIVEMSGGGIVKAELGMGSAANIEAEGNEKDIHGIGREYEDEDEDILKKKMEEPEPEKEYIFPPYDLLTSPSSSANNNRQELKETAEKLQRVLNNFGVKARVSNVICGPSVTRYEVTPEIGVKVSKVVNLQDDIKLNLAASDIRIEAPIPGKAAIGIEVPNKNKVGVTLREMLENEEFINHRSKLAFTLGKDIEGKDMIVDIAKMPHLLIAGTTGSGKSVCVNSIICSIIYHAKPTEVKMLMIDPKVVELKMYDGIPHLLRPVITDMKQATGALNWAVTEMNRRYKLFADNSVKDIAGYNNKMKEMSIYDNKKHNPLPQILVIVDELADMMMSAPAEVEDSIQHLAQMARAAGMHLVLITQRPTTNVVTGTIKSNIPGRIALAVSSGIDSRVMLDSTGAEKLMGNGDMLYSLNGIKPIRLQGPYVSDTEINKVADFLREQGKVSGGGSDKSIEIHFKTEAKQTDTAREEEQDGDVLTYEVGEYIITSEKASIGAIQRKFRVGFNRAARIVDLLTEKGVVGPENGTKPRDILMTLPEFKALMNRE